MVAATAVALEEYLATHFEHDAEWVDGEVIQRPMPTMSHAETQGRLFELTPRQFGGSPVRRGVELRVNTGDRYRVIDFAAYAGDWPGDVPTTPPLIAAEVLSEDESMSKLVDKLEEYRTWGVRHCWVLDPIHRQLYFYDNALRPATVLSAPEIGLEIGAAAIWEAC